MKLREFARLGNFNWFSNDCLFLEMAFKSCFSTLATSQSVASTGASNCIGDCCFFSSSFGFYWSFCFGLSPSIDQEFFIGSEFECCKSCLWWWHYSAPSPIVVDLFKGMDLKNELRIRLSLLLLDENKLSILKSLNNLLGSEIRLYEKN